jgi:hypothetical protein
MARIGADVEQLEGLAMEFLNASRSLEGMTKQIGARVAETWWEGTDAKQFKDSWASDFRVQLDKVASALYATHVKVRQQAQQQREASGG